ncbi:hypothetical protein LN040_03870 [Desulfovibrio subterraneus]|uniref:hypothetical protein n=1 Tax=Desulfovibrio subterraneus TaxID=2718620 RepID=UPI0022B938AD|nr:hypothetical protein [Desulfovibrio subterraneus]WBF68251.1 hypothetical protein LN040_03870 [Desulfovibrio subterraneus]
MTKAAVPESGPYSLEKIRAMQPLTDSKRARAFSDAELTANAQSDPDNPLLSEDSPTPQA